MGEHKVKHNQGGCLNGLQPISVTGMAPATISRSGVMTQSREEMLESVKGLIKSEAIRCYVRMPKQGMWSMEDLVQESTAVAIAAIDSYEEGHGTKLSTWVTRMVKHHCGSLLSREHIRCRNRVTPELELEGNAPEEQVSRHAADYVLTERLTEDTLKILDCVLNPPEELLRLWTGRAPATKAASILSSFLGVPKGSVKRSLEALRACAV
jgi:DNA-directed RNA polymerase specialized sigma24 family protein